MNTNEFDNYLTLLSSLLQLRGEQREAIAGELKAHLEDRLDDLLARGLDRDAAVRIALEEFGDAAGLANNFSLLVRNRRRRWLVKVTSFSTAAVVLLALGLIAIWPEHRPGPGPARAVAQNPNAADPNVRDPNVGRGGSDSATATVKPGGNTSDILDEKLSNRITAEFVETPLNDVLNFLSDTADVQIFINRKAMQDEGIEADTPVSINLKSVRLDMLLDLVLEQVGSNTITYVERDGILIVSTMANLEGASEVRVYNCRDLLAMEPPRGEKAGRALPGVPGPATFPPGFAPGPAAAPPGGSGPPPAINGGIGGGVGMMGGSLGGGESPPLTEAERRAEALKHLIQTAVKPDSWAEQGSFGTISEYNGLLVINHNTKTHKQIENVLKMLREAAGLEPGKTPTSHKQ